MGTAALEPASTLDAVGQTLSGMWVQRRQVPVGLSEGEGHGLELPGNIASLWPPHSVRSILCTPALTSDS